MFASLATLARSQLHTSMRYQPIFNGLKYTLHRALVLNNVVITTIIEMVEIVEILDGRVVKRSVEQVRYVINNLWLGSSLGTTVRNAMQAKHASQGFIGQAERTRGTK